MKYLKSLIISLILVYLFVAKAQSAQAADLQVTNWINNCTIYDACSTSCLGNSTWAAIAIKNISSRTLSFNVTGFAFSCGQANLCTVGCGGSYQKQLFPVVNLLPGASTYINANQTWKAFTPQSSCGSAQTDFIIDKTDSTGTVITVTDQWGVGYGPYFGFAFENQNCAAPKPLPTRTPTPKPSATSAPKPTFTPTPTSVLPSLTLPPGVTPSPTSPPAPSPYPTVTPLPTITPTPTPQPTFGPTPTPPPPIAQCTYTMGFWKTHYPDAWPVNSLTLGTRVTPYSDAELESILNTSPRGNGLIILAHQLITAKLNVENGADPTSIISYIQQADGMIGNLVVPPVGSGYLDPAATDALTTTLDNYNSGLTGPGHCN